MSEYSSTLKPKVDVVRLRDEHWANTPDWSCFWSDLRNPKGFQLTPTIEGGVIFADMAIEKHHTGFPLIAHGGVAFSILDGLMAWHMMAYHERMGFTTKTSVQYLGPLRAGRTYRFFVDQEAPPTAQGTCLVGTVFEKNKPEEILVRTVGDFMFPKLSTAERIMGIAVPEDMKRFFGEYLP